MSNIPPIFQERLKKKLEEKKLNINAAETKLGLKKSAIRNIINGRSKNPGIEILYAIAQELGCTIEEILGKDNPPITDIPTADVKSKALKGEENLYKELNYDLFVSACQAVIKELKKREITIPHRVAINYINEVYWYGLKKGAHQADEFFTEWLIEEKIL